MEEDNFIEELDKRRQLFYYGGIACMVLCFVILYVVFFYKPSPKKNEAVVGKGESPAVVEDVYDVMPMTKEDCLVLEGKDKIQACLDGIILSDAIDRDNFLACGGIVVEETRNDCMNRVADNLKDVDLCLKIPDIKKKETCVSDVAIASRDPSICATVFSESFELKECQDVATSFAIASSGKKDDIKECAKLGTEEYAHLCLLNSFGSKYGGDCSKVPVEFRQYCIDEDAMITAKEAKDCDVVVNPDYKDLCLKVAELGLMEARRIDTDKDGIADGNELFMNLDPKNPDTDGDRLGDGNEWLILGTDPGNPDTDGDGLNDYQETQIYHTNPKNPDTDGDGRKDGLEVKMNKDPLTKD